MEQNIPVRAKKLSKQQLADQYIVSVKTFITWLRRNPELLHLANDHRQLYTPAEVKLIYDKLGLPEKLLQAYYADKLTTHRPL